MSILDDIDATRQATEALGQQAMRLTEAIANAPAPRNWTVRIKDQDVVICDRDTPLILMAYVLGLAREKDIAIPLLSGDVWRAQLGDIEAAARQILKPDRGGGDVSTC